ncbi:MAG: cysteine--tRNA ligase [Gammaproteobacteria bacterium]
MLLYNTQSKKKEIFRSILPQKVSLYVCGPTVYNYCHIGNARVFVVFDMLRRYFEATGYKVTYVRNITDVDDKIIQRAKEIGITPKELSEQFTIAFHEDEKALGNLPPTVEPKATEHIHGIIEMISSLIQKGFAYVAQNGDVYFEVSKFEDYGKLAHQDLDSLKSGARVEVVSVKRDPLDFILWKMAKPGEPSWKSPWGDGRPGWHSECAVMSTLHLGKSFDIHGGGSDLKFPHHQNEVAQAVAWNNCTMANYWLHVGFVEINKEKMSKSKGNFFTLREVLKEYHPEVIRLFMFLSHYRSPIDYSKDNLDTARTALRRLYNALQHSPHKFSTLDEAKNLAEKLKEDKTFAKIWEDFWEAMADDLNTPLAFANLFNLANLINKLQPENPSTANDYSLILRSLGQEVFGILKEDPLHFLQTGNKETSLKSEEIDALIQERKKARQEKNWSKADEIRKKLMDLGIELEDTADGTVWKQKS